MMHVSNTVFLLMAMVHALGTVIPSVSATEIKRKLDPSKKKDSKKSNMPYDDIEEGILQPFLSMSFDLPAMSFSMSYPPKKGSKKGGGKGKGSGSDEIGKGKGSKKGPATSKKGSKKTSKSEKKGTGKGQGQDTHPGSPTPSSSADDNSRPPSPIPPERPPASSPGSTPSPTAEGAPMQQVALPSYGIQYVLSESVMPMREDYLQVEEVTNNYFSDYMLQVFAEPTDNSLVQFTTSLVTSEFRFDEPVVITYESIAYFAGDFPASSLPSPETLEFLLQQALEDPTEYLDLLAGLGEENAFSTTVSVNFTDAPPVNATESDPTTRSSNPGSGNAGTSPVVIAAGAVGVALLVFGVVAYKRRMSENDDDTLVKKNGKNYGGATVAGETYAGETYDGTASVSPSSHQSSRDEEHALMNVDLDEAESTIDNISVAPAWEGSVSSTSNHDESHDDDDCDGSNRGSGRGKKLWLSSQDNNPNKEHDENGEDHSHAVTASGNDGSGATHRSVENYDVYLGAPSDMTMDSHGDDEEIQSIQSARRPLSVAEIESMLNTSF